MRTGQRPRPNPPPSPCTHHARRAATWPRSRRASAAPPPRRRTRPLPLSFQQVPRLLPLSAPRVWPLLMVPVASSVLPLPRTNSSSHPLRELPIAVSTGPQAEHWARQRGAIAERQERPGLPPSTPPGIRASAWTEPTRGAPPPSQSIHAESTDPTLHEM